MEEVKLLEYIPEFVEAFKEQLIADDKRWGNTWLNRVARGQEARFKGDIKDYYDKFFFGKEPMPWLKVIGNAYICWVRTVHPELWEEKDEM